MSKSMWDEVIKHKHDIAKRFVVERDYIPLDLDDVSNRVRFVAQRLETVADDIKDVSRIEHDMDLTSRESSKEMHKLNYSIKDYGLTVGFLEDKIEDVNKMINLHRTDGG